MEALSDNAIMLKVKLGDIDKMALLYERYKKPVFAYFFRIIEDREQSEDLVQSVFYRMLKYRAQYRGDGKFTTWMFGIAHNLVVDTIRKKGHVLVSKESIENRNTEFEHDAAHMFEKSEQVQMIRLCIKKLDSDKREVLVLSKYHELKYKEIAGILNISENSVKQRVFRAMEELRKVYLEMTN
ncbi:MAG: sigma-70 family RNA polymerase sigma factor [Bacteroidales bacterium]